MTAALYVDSTAVLLLLWSIVSSVLLGVSVGIQSSIDDQIKNISSTLQRVELLI